jgi:hypothetical protein
MAPTKPIVEKKPTKVSPKLDEDEKWTDLAEKEDIPSPSPPAPPAARLPPMVANAQPQNLLPFSVGGPVGPTPLHPPFPVDPYGRTTPTEQSTLEGQLMHLAEVVLGVLNAMAIIESHLTKVPEGFTQPKDIEIISYSTDTALGTAAVSRPGATRSNHYNGERHTYTQMLRDMGYLLGLRRAVKILQEAAADKDLENVTYKLKVIQLPNPPTPPPMPMIQPMGLPPQIPQYVTVDKLKENTKEAIKDAIKEYKDTVLSPGMENVQQEMIKLCRDVCRDALNKKD